MHEQSAACLSEGFFTGGDGRDVLKAVIPACSPAPHSTPAPAGHWSLVWPKRFRHTWGCQIPWPWGDALGWDPSADP